MKKMLLQMTSGFLQLASTLLKHVVDINLMRSPNQNLPLSKEEGIWKRKIGV
jgi:hypothetical protein